MSKRNNISVYIAAAVLIILTVCGSFWDLEIAAAVYLGEAPSDNLFGIIFSYIGVIPTFVGWSFLGAGILCLSKKTQSDAKRELMAFAILLLVLSFFYFCNTLYFSTANTFKMPVVAAYAVGTAVICAAAKLGYKLAKASDDPQLLQKALFLAAVSLVALVIISGTKEIMCRPRFRLVLAMDAPEYFRNWWQSGREIKAALADGSVSDEFASLPSGHSAYSMFAVFMFPALADYVHKLKRARPHLFVLGFAWWAVTAFSRLTMGAHYLTDVTIAGLVTLLAYTMVSAAVKIRSKRKT